MSTPADDHDDQRSKTAFQIESEKVKYVRPGLGKWLARAALLGIVGNVGLLALGIVLKSLHLGALAFWFNLPGNIGSTIFWLSPVLGALSVAVTSISFPRPGPAKISISPEGVRLQRGRRSRFIAREKIADGLVIPSPASSVALHLKSGSQLSFDVNTEGEADRALNTLGISADRRRAVATLGGPGPQLMAGCASFGIATIGFLFLLVAIGGMTAIDYGLPLALTALVAITWAAFRSFRPTEVAIGTDGVRIRKAWRSRFIPFSSIENVSPLASKLLLQVKREGESPLDLENVTVASGDQRLIEGLANRIADAMKRGGDSEDAEAEVGAATAELLNPRGRSLPAWREALAALTREEGGYRRRALSAESLAGILADPGAPAGQRIGAAIALRSSGHPTGAERIRVAAEACASDPLREALEQAAQDELDEATLEQALAEASPEALKRA